MDQRGLDEVGIGVLGALGDVLINGPGGRGVPCTVAFRNTWAHAPNGPGYHSQIAGFGASLPGGIAAGGFIPDRVIQAASTSPGEVQASMDQINAGYDILDGSVTKDVHDASFTDQWKGDLNAWKAFYNDSRSTATILLRGTLTVAQQAESFRQRLIAWNDAYQNTTGHHALVPPPGQENPPKAGTPWWAISLMTIGGLAVVGWLAYKAYDKLSPTSIAMHHLRGAHDPAFGGTSYERDPDYGHPHGGVRYIQVPVYSGY